VAALPANFFEVGMGNMLPPPHVVNTRVVGVTCAVLGVGLAFNVGAGMFAASFANFGITGAAVSAGATMQGAMVAGAAAVPLFLGAWLLDQRRKKADAEEEMTGAGGVAEHHRHLHEHREYESAYEREQHEQHQNREHEQHQEYEPHEMYHH
jgi:hypothetical protein